MGKIDIGVSGRCPGFPSSSISWDFVGFPGFPEFPIKWFQVGVPKRVECFFCGRYDTRGLEHVFADTWLREFQAGQERIVIDRHEFGTDTLENTRTHTFDSFLCGDVCEKCNSGWMRSLEDTVKPWIRGITSKADLSALQDPIRQMPFSRWALKTACVIDRLGGLSQIPADIPRQLTESRGLPSNVHVLIGWHPSEYRSLFSLNQRSTWITYPLEPAVEVPALPGEGWFKVAFSIEQLMVLVVGVPSRDLQLVIGTGIHVPIWPETKIDLHHWYYSMRLEGLNPSEALQKFSDLLALSRDGRLANRPASR